MSFVGPFPLDDALERARGEPAFRFVGQAADLATALKQVPAAVPALYLVREERVDRTVYGTGCYVQHMRAVLACVLFVRNYAQADSGAAARVEMDELIAKLRLRMLGWRPRKEFRALELFSDSDNLYAAANLSSTVVFASTYRITVNT